MKKIVSLVLTVAIISIASAQTVPDQNKINLADRAGDHFMVQLSTDHWLNMPDTINSHQHGFSRGLNIYFMIDKPFKTNPHWSIAFGLGVSNSDIFFKNMTLGIAATGTTTLPITTTDGADHFKKYKLATSFLDVPVELRYTFHPEHEKKSWKLALGIKPGIMLDAHTKAKNLEDPNSNVIADYTEKESSTDFFNTAHICVTARVGYGNFSLFGSYQANSVFKVSPVQNIQLLQVGVCISGL